MKLHRISGFIASLVALLCATAMHAQQPLATTIATLLADPKIAGAHWGISVTQLDGTPIYALNDAQLFQPASNVKLFTTAAALALLGPERTYKTTVRVMGYRTGDDSVKGWVRITGDGDAFLSDRVVPYSVKASDATTPPTLSKLDALAEKIAKSGIKTIDGGIEARSDYPWELYAEGWNNDDLPWGYGAPVTDLVLNDNELQLTVTPAATAGYSSSLALAPDLHLFTLQNDVRTTEPKSITHIEVVREGFLLHVTGQIAMGAKSDLENVAVGDPILYIAKAFKALLAQHGVNVTGSVQGGHVDLQNSAGTRSIIRTPLDLDPAKIPDHGPRFDESVYNTYHTPATETLAEAEHISPPLLDDVIATNKNSVNLHAELLLRKLADYVLADNTKATFAQGARVVRQFAINAGISGDDFYFVDGSGLSNYDLATPRAFTQLLRYAAKQPWGADYRSSLPIGGVDGTLEHRFTKAPLKGNVFAKTGTLSEDRALSGYLICASGKTIVFSILAGDHLPGSTADRDAMDKIVAAIAAAN